MSACTSPPPSGGSAAEVLPASCADSAACGPSVPRLSPKKASRNARQPSPVIAVNEKRKLPAAAAAGVAATKPGKRRTKPAEEAARQGATPDADAAARKPFPNAVGLYPDLEDPPEPVRLCRHGTHTAPQFQQSPNGLTVWNEKGYRLTKATHGVEEGAWYYELTIGERPKGNENLRVGWAQISADLQGPCGMDCFAYGYRMTPGTVFHESRGRQYGTGYAPGDILGCLIHIPPLTAMQTKDLESRRWKVGEPYARSFRPRLPKPTNGRTPTQRRRSAGKASKRRKRSSFSSTAASAASSSEELMPEDAEAKTRRETAVEGRQPTSPTEETLSPPLESVKGSQIVFFKNGRCEGVAFSDIFLGKYHPAISSYMSGKVVANFGPVFAFPPPVAWEGLPVRPMSESYGAGKAGASAGDAGEACTAPATAARK